MVGEYEKKILMSLLSGDKDWAKLKIETKLADGTLAKYIKKLLQKGFISERVDMKDRRKKIYQITNKGKQVLVDDLIAVDLAVDCFICEHKYITNWLREGKTEKEMAKKFIENSKKFFGSLYLASLVDKDWAVPIYLGALYLYSELTTLKAIVEKVGGMRKLFEDVFLSRKRRIEDNFKEQMGKLEWAIEIAIRDVKVWEIVLNDDDIFRTFYQGLIESLEDPKKVENFTEEKLRRNLEFYLSNFKNFLAVLSEHPIFSSIIEEKSKNIVVTRKEVLKEIQRIIQED